MRTKCFLNSLLFILLCQSEGIDSKAYCFILTKSFTRQPLGICLSKKQVNSSLVGVAIHFLLCGGEQRRLSSPFFLPCTHCPPPPRNQLPATGPCIKHSGQGHGLQVQWLIEAWKGCYITCWSLVLGTSDGKSASTPSFKEAGFGRCHKRQSFPSAVLKAGTQGSCLTEDCIVVVFN